MADVDTGPRRLVEVLRDATRGVLDLKDMVYFVSLIVFFLFANTAIVELKKAD